MIRFQGYQPMPRRSRSQTVKSINQMDMFPPQSQWRPLQPHEWPDFKSHAKFIGVDTETHDPNLQKKGPGFIRGDALVCGISLASEDGHKVYLPIHHPEDNCEDPDIVIDYVKDMLSGDQPKCGANLMYDLEALDSLGIKIEGPFADIQVAEPLLDEDKQTNYQLDTLAREYLNVTKNEDLLRKAANLYGIDPKKDLALLPARYVGAYGEDDAYLPIKIFQHQVDRLKEDNVWDIFLLEQELQPILFKMRKMGVRVDVDKAEQLSKETRRQEDQIIKDIYKICGVHINPGSGPEVAKALRSAGLDVPITLKGNPSITDAWLQDQDNRLCSLINLWRKTTKMRRDFVDTIRDDHVQGRIYSNWHQLRDSEGGTRSGRISASRFNLTQVPGRDPEWGPKIRGLFLPDEGGRWLKADYSQQEPRILLHLAYITLKLKRQGLLSPELSRLTFDGVEEARQRYIDDPSTDYHQMVADLVFDKSRRNIGRRAAKDINLGSAYGMGKKKLASKLGVEWEIAEQLFYAYHEGVPYVKDIEKACMYMAQTRGYIKTILGRKRRFNDWENPKDEGWTIRGEVEARKRWPNTFIQRAFVHKALNSAVQGSAADQMKKSLLLLNQEGLLPQIQIYDEIDGTFSTDKEATRVKEIMETAVQLEVPSLVEPEWGSSWAGE